MTNFLGKIQTTRLASAPASPVVGELYYDTTANALYYWNGTAWITTGNEVYEQASQPSSTTVGALWIDTDEVPPAWGPTIPLVSALPGSPFDGQEVYYLADATNGAIWHLRYRAASASAYKWEFVGGPPIQAAVETTESPLSAAAWVNLPTNGPQITLPCAGDYIVKFWAHATNTNASATSMYAGVAAGDTTPPVYSGAVIYFVNSQNGQAILTHEHVWRGQAAGTVLKMRYQSVDIASSKTFTWRHMEVLPVRLS